MRHEDLSAKVSRAKALIESLCKRWSAISQKNQERYCYIDEKTGQRNAQHPEHGTDAADAEYKRFHEEKKNWVQLELTRFRSEVDKLSQLADVLCPVGESNSFNMETVRLSIDEFSQYDGRGTGGPINAGDAIRTLNRLADRLRAAPSSGHAGHTITHSGRGNINMSTGDKIEIDGNVSGSAIGRGAKLEALDIATYNSAVDNSQHLDADLKTRLKDARGAVEKLALSESDKNDVLDDLGKFTGEMEKETPEPGRLQKLLTRIKENAPTVVTILSGAVAVAKLIAVAHGHPTNH